ncbi:MAG: HAD-IIIA family hydrolase [Gemmatimonadaceae bacterium]
MQREELPYRLVIFDADDTLRRTLVPGQPCPRAAHEWELMPRVAERLRSIPWGTHGLLLGVASNQDQIAYGHLSEATARDLLLDMIARASGHVPPDDAVQLCPHALEQPCDCRKPAPGMLLSIMDYYGVSPAETLFVGNALTDEEAARGAGASFALADDFFDWSREQS